MGGVCVCVCVCVWINRTGLKSRMIIIPAGSVGSKGDSCKLLLQITFHVNVLSLSDGLSLANTSHFTQKNKKEIKKLHYGRKKQPNYKNTQLIHPWEIEMLFQMIRLIPNYGYRRTLSRGSRAPAHSCFHKNSLPTVERWRAAADSKWWRESVSRCTRWTRPAGPRGGARPPPAGCWWNRTAPAPVQSGSLPKWSSVASRDASGAFRFLTHIFTRVWVPPGSDGSEDGSSVMCLVRFCSVFLFWVYRTTSFNARHTNLDRLCDSRFVSIGSSFKRETATVTSNRGSGPVTPDPWRALSQGSAGLWILSWPLTCCWLVVKNILSFCSPSFGEFIRILVKINISIQFTWDEKVLLYI